MKKTIYLLVIIAIILVLIVLDSDLTSDKDSLYQVSTIDALLAGVYDGETTIKKLKKQGDFGIGTFDGLDGEMVILDNEVYKIKINGKVDIIDNSEKTPFAVTTFFKPDLTISLEGDFNYSELEYYIDQSLESKNIFYAIKITQEFEYIKTRSVPKQEKPYPPLAEVIKEQEIFEFNNQEGTLVGFRSPDYVQGINVPGYHMHLLTDDKQAGGHVLALTITNPIIEIDFITNFQMELPTKGDFYDIDLKEDKSEELEAVEKDK